MTKKILIGMIFLLLCVSNVLAISSQTTEYPAKPSNNDAQFIVKVLKYEPFPVNPGDWFDLWVKIENVGEEDATNLRVELLSDSTFEVQDSIQEYGKIVGTANAYKFKQGLGDNNIETNQVLLKFHIRTKSDAVDGTKNIQLSISTDGTAISIIHNLPIDISKTKTDLSVTLNDISPQETVFDLSNVGDLPAKAVLVSVKDTEDALFLQKYSPVAMGDLASGETGTIHLSVLPKEEAKDITLLISYTDSSGVRTTIEKKIQISKNDLEALCPPSKDLSYLLWIYGAVGFLCGAFLVILSVLFIHRHKGKRQK